MYNTAQYLPRCLDSICGQTLREIEIICINDASPDNALGIAREYAANDHRITVVDFSRNRGVSAARNAAIGMADGEYLSFVDSDDAVERNFYEKLYGKACETGAPIVKGVQFRIFEDGTRIQDFINDKVRENKCRFGGQWSTAIFRTALIRENGIDCPLGVSNNQDVAFQLKAVSLASCVETVDDAYFYYYRRQCSSNSALLEYKKILAVLKSFEDVLNFINRHEEICAEDYDMLFWPCVAACEKLLHRRSPDDDHSPPACAEAAIAFYHSCKRRKALDAKLSFTHPGILGYLRTRDSGGLLKYLSTEKSAAQRIAAGLRRRLAAAQEQ
jgi:glycosyltransferase involved in cell wall biosynthesis